MNKNLQDDWSGHWTLRRNIQVNHGSFGATPIEILKRQAKMVEDFNTGREDCLWGDGQTDSMLIALREAVVPLAQFVGADADDMVYVDNVTDAFSSVIRSVTLGPGDQVLVTNHMYANFPAPLKELARRQGFEVVVAEIPYPPESDDQIVDAIMAKATDKTRLAIIDHIPSPTALIFPIKRIVAALRDKGIETFVDGAHAPGQIPVNVDDIGAAYYSANNHKWICSPVGSGFLHVRRDKQDDIMPAVGSGAASREIPFTERFTWRGTKDMSAHLMVPETIKYMAGLHPGGWPGIYERNHALAIAARDVMLQKFGIGKPYPDHMVGSMFTVPLGKLCFPKDIEAEWSINRLRLQLINKHGFGVCSTEFEGQYLLRVSSHLYNNLGQYHDLADALAPMLKDYAPRDVVSQPQAAPPTI